MEKQVNLDRISNLPWDVLDSILVHMPLKEAVRTSVLSSKWRYKWTGLSQFIIDDKCFTNTILDKLARWKEIMKIIHQVQLNHGGPIEKFTLGAYCHPDHAVLDQWVYFLAQKGIKELILQEFDSVKRFKLPSCLFSCSQLNRLELSDCSIKLSCEFRGFNNLAILQLTQVYIDSDTLENLVLNCPVLERLTLSILDNQAVFKIHNPNLQYLKIDSYFLDICLENSPSLDVVDIRLRPDKHQPRRFELGQPCNVARVLSCLPGVKRLTLCCEFLQFLANRNIPERHRSLLDHLSVLDLREVRFRHLKEVMVALCILRSAPNLEKLFVSVYDQTTDFSKPVIDFLRGQYMLDLYLNHLRVVTIRGIGGVESPEWEFIKFILAHSPGLETITIVRYRGERVPQSLFQQVERASKLVKLISLTL